MSLFQTNYEKPGPGVSCDTPRKTGVARLIEVLGRDAVSFWKAGFLLLLSSLPAAIGIWVAAESGSAVLLIGSSVLGGALAGPQLCGLIDTILRSLRDEAGFWWYTYRQAWHRNVRTCLLPGAVTGLLLGMQIFVLCNLDHLTITVSFMAVLIIGCALMIGLGLLIWAQIALFRLTLSQLLRNALLLFLLSPARTAGAIAVQVLYWGFLWLFAPASLPLLVLTGAWLPFLISIFLLYLPIEKSFDLENAIHEVQEERYRDPSEK